MKRASVMRRFSVLGILLILSTALVSAQTTSRLDGLVKDPSSAAIVGAKVTLTNTQTNAMMTTMTDDQGLYVFAQVPVGLYRVAVEMTGFKKGVVEGVKVDVAIPATVNVVLEVGQVTEVVEITASEGQAVINSVNAELNTVVNQRQILELPLNGRSPIQLAGLQAGVASAAGAGNPRDARINGLRGSYNNLTHDGINIQDNFVRTGGLFAQSAPRVDNTAEFSITTQGAGVETGTGTAQVRLVTPSGTNSIHGSVFEFHRNTALDANRFFNNAAGLPREKLIRNQYGFRVDGPVIKNKFFYFGYLEIFREATTGAISRNVLTDAMRRGMFTYVRTDNGQQQTVDLLQLAGGRTIDPYIQRLLSLTPLPNDPLSTDLNVRAFRFNSPNPTENENWSFRLDYNLTENHHLEGVYQQFHFRFPNDTFNDIGEPFPGLPGGGQSSLRKRFSTAWRSTWSSSLTNELRFGFTHAPVKFTNSEEFADGFILGTTTNRFIDIPAPDPYYPIQKFQPQGRSAPNFEWIDNAAWVKGNHSVRFGGNVRYVYADPFNDVGIVPEYLLGFGATNNVNPLTTALFPGGISASNFSSAGGLLAMLTGSVTRGTQTFNVTSRDSGFVPDATELRTLRQTLTGFFIGDTWRARSNLTVNFGLRYEYFLPINEKDGLALLPRGGALAVLDPNAVVDFAGEPGQGLYNGDKNNFAPNLSFAWDPFGTGRTSIRAGFSINYVLDSDLTAVRNAFRNNDGLVSTRTLTNLSGTVSAGGITTIAPPPFLVPRTTIDNLVTISPTPTLFTIDPNYRTPYVQQWSLSVEREIFKDTAVEIRYVGNRGTKLSRGVDLNQLNPFGANGQFVRDFMAAQRNLIANNDPYRGEPVPTFELLGNRGSLASFRTQLLNGEVGELISLYLASRNTYFVSPAPSRFAGGERFGATVGADFFFPNGNVLVADVLGNYSFSTYHGAQVELRRRFSNGLAFQGNYTFSKNLTDLNGSQTNFQGLLDNARPQLEKTRSDQDITHVFNGNFLYELPFGPGKSFLNASGIAGKIFGGWQISGIMNWQSGEPVSIVSARGTFNRAARSGNNSVNTSLTKEQLQKATGLFHLPNGRPVLFDPTLLAISSSGAVTGANTALFQNPTAGQLGSLALTPASGPYFFNVDFSVMKRTYVTEAINVEFRAEFFNVLNRTNFNIGQVHNINGSTFGAITATFDPRILQFALKVNF